MLQRILFSAPLAALLGIGFLVRLVALLLYLATHNWQGEQWEYELIAQNLLNGRGFVIERYNALYHAFIPPLFPLICYLLHLAAGTGPFYLVLYYTYHLGLALGIIWLSYRLAREWFGRPTATLAGWLIALEPGLIVYQSYKMDVITLATFLLLAALVLFQRLVRSHALGTAAALGVLIGLGLLARLDLVILVGLLGVWLASERRHFQEILKPLAATLIALLLVVSPWTLRNYVVFDRFVFIASTAGEWLWMGNNPNSVGTPVDPNGRGVFHGAPATLQQSVLAGTDEFQVNGIFMEDAIRHITSDPWRYARLAVAKFWYFWWFTPTYGWTYQQIGQAWQQAYKVLHGICLGFALFGVWLAVRENRPDSRQGVLVILTVCLFLAVIHGLTYVEGRHRLLIEPLLLILTARGIKGVWERAIQVFILTSPANGSTSRKVLSGSPRMIFPDCGYLRTGPWLDKSLIDQRCMRQRKM